MHNACCDVVVPLLQMKKAVDFGVKSLKGNLCVLAATNHQMYNHNRAMKLKSKRHLSTLLTIVILFVHMRYHLAENIILKGF